jgi:hypothetical protein
MSSSQRQKAMALNVGPAAFLIKDAVIGQQDAPYEGWYDPYNDDSYGNEFRNAVSVICGRLIASNWIIRLLVYVPNWTLFLLSLIEPPQWCRSSSLEMVEMTPHRDSLYEYGDCAVLLAAYGIPATLGNETDTTTTPVDLYPNTNSMFLSIKQTQQIELCCIWIIGLYMLLELGRDGLDTRFFFYKGAKRILHSLRCVLLVFLVISIIIHNTTYNPFLRMLLLTTHLRNFQRELLSVMKMVRYTIR